jgi:hypothetical protein
MKLIAVLLLAVLPVPQISLPVRAPGPQPHFSEPAQSHPHKSGKWYFARTGHAVYCFGPVMTAPSADGEIERVATFCRGDQLIVPLKD